MSQKWDLSSVLEYFQEDSEISQTLDAEEFKNLMNPDREFLKTLKAALEYQGFDPRVIMKQLIRNRNTYLQSDMVDLSWDLENAAGDFEVTSTTKPSHRFTNRESLARDLEFLITMFLLRNNHISKIIKKSFNGLEPILNMLREKYDINDETRKSGTSLGSKDITLPRITGAVPSVAVRLYHDKQIKETVPFHTIPGVASLDSVEEAGISRVGTSTWGSTITHAICCPFLPSLHPRTGTGVANIHAIMLYVAIRLDDIIHKKEKDYTSLNDLMTYYRAGFESSATPEKARLEVFSRIGLISGTDHKFTSEAIRINASCLEALKNMRVNDENHIILLDAARSGVLPE